MTQAELIQMVVEGVTASVADRINLLTKSFAESMAAAEVRIAELESLRAHGPLDLEAIAEKAAALVPRPEDGQPGANGRDADPVDLDLLALKAAELVPRPKDGKDGTSVSVADMTPIVLAEVASVLAGLPKPKDGKDGSSVSVEDVAPLIQAEVSKAFAALPPPKDPAAIVGALIDRDGHLVLTLSDGATKDVGPIVGKDGADGADGRDVDPSDVLKRVEDLVAKFPVPKDGKDGRDGVGFENMDAEYDERGRMFLVFTRDGSESKRFHVPGIVDQGVWRPEVEYVKGSGVTLEGSFWIAQADTTGERPGNGKTPWRLSVKRGDIGKTGPKGDPGDKGKDGKDGIDLNRRGY